jgi:hypothetical protein
MKLQSTLAVFLAFASLAACNHSLEGIGAADRSGDGLAYNGGIFGGSKPAENDPISRAVVGVEFRMTGREAETCTGTLIAPRAVLTAAHCAQVSPQNISVVLAPELGPTLPSEARRTVSRVFVHPSFAARQDDLFASRQWDQANQFDIAIVYLAEPVPASFVPFAMAAGELPAGAIVSAAGFGARSFDQLTGGRTGGGVLQTAVMRMLESKQENILLFDQANGSGVCVGDSGGPAYVIADQAPGSQPPIIYGIASSVRNPGQTEACEGVSRFVSVPSIKAWVDSILAN